MDRASLFQEEVRTMARASEPHKSMRSATTARKPGRPPVAATKTPATAPKSAAAKRSAAVAKAPEKGKPGHPAKVGLGATTARTAARTAKVPARLPAAPSAVTVSKDELRSQVERLEHVAATLRARSRETSRAAKAASARISELEMQVEQLEKTAAMQAPVVARQAKAGKPPRAERKSREIDPGDAVPPGVAVQQPAPLDQEAETALENLEEHLGHN